MTTEPEEPSPLSAEARQRLREALAHRGLSQRDLSRVILVGETTIGAILSGKQKPQFATILAIFSELKVHPSWILWGIGPAYIDEPGAPSESRAGLKAVVTTGADAWLIESKETTTPAERAFVRGCPWPAPDMRMPDLCYQLALTAYRHAASHVKSQPRTR